MTRTFSLSPAAIFRSVARNRDLIRQMVVRDTTSRYRSSAGGLVWAIVNPLLMLAVYLFFFGVVFPMKWHVESGTRADFALILFAGLILHGFFTELLMRSPNLVVSQANLVRKVVFPIEVFPFVACGSALFHLVVNVAVWIGFCLVLRGGLPATSLLYPVVVLPLAILALGMCWLLSALGVYLRDLNHLMPMISSVLLFASPVFYPLSTLDQPLRTLVAFGPLAIPIEMSRDVLLWGRVPDPLTYAAYLAVALLVACLGFAWFQATRKGFPDVL